MKDRAYRTIYRYGRRLLVTLLAVLGMAACSSRPSTDAALDTLGGAHFSSSTLVRGSLSALFTVRGVGNPEQSGYRIGLLGTADVIATCTNKGNTAAVGVNDVVASADLALPITGSIGRNGTFTGEVTLPDITELSSQDVCKNRNWTITRLQTRWKSAVLSVYVPGSEPDDRVCFVISEDDGETIEFSAVSCPN